MSKQPSTKPFHNSSIPSDWEVMELGELFEFKNGINAGKESYGKGVKFINVMEVIYSDYITSEMIPGSVQISDDQKELYQVKHGDVLFNRTSETIDEIGLTSVYYGNDDVVFGGFVIRGRPINNLIDDKFKKYCFRSKIVRDQIIKGGQGAVRTNIGQGDLEKVEVPLPPLPEQKAIAHILGLMDAAINKNNFLIAKKELQKRWLMPQLLSGKLRIKKIVENEQSHKTSVGQLPVDWKLNSIENILTPVRKVFIPDKDELYQQIGIRSHTKGIFYKEKVTGAILGDKRVFWIEPDCFIVNIVFAWEHAIAKTTEKEVGMIASHRFPMFKPKEEAVDLDYLLYYFNSLRGKHLLGLASPGGAGRNKTLGQSEFMKLQIPIPSYEEQTAIAQVLKAADKEIQLLKTKTEKLREKKKGLMQQLLTGKKD